MVENQHKKRTVFGQANQGKRYCSQDKDNNQLNARKHLTKCSNEVISARALYTVYTGTRYLARRAVCAPVEEDDGVGVLGAVYRHHRPCPDLNPCHTVLLIISYHYLVQYQVLFFGMSILFLAIFVDICAEQFARFLSNKK